MLLRLNMLLAAGAEEVEMGAGAMLVSLSPIILMALLFIFMIYRPQKKREKAVQEMRSKVEVGDEIITEGGIIGRVVNIRDEWLVIETGSDRSKIRIARWAIRSNNTVHDDTPGA